MWVVFIYDIFDDVGWFMVWFVLFIVVFMYWIEDVVMDWFEVVVYIWKCVWYDYVYGVIEIVVFYFIDDGDWFDIRWKVVWRGVVVLVS